jgi:hypothetical protein
MEGPSTHEALCPTSAKDGARNSILRHSETIPMKLFLMAFLTSALLTTASAFAGNDEPLTGGSQHPKSARFEVTPAQRYWTAVAQQEAAHRRSLLQTYDWMGIDYGRPQINAGVFYLAPPPVRTRRIQAYPYMMIESSGGYSF